MSALHPASARACRRSSQYLVIVTGHYVVVDTDAGEVCDNHTILSVTDRPVQHAAETRASGMEDLAVSHVIQASLVRVTIEANWYRCRLETGETVLMMIRKAAI